MAANVCAAVRQACRAVPMYHFRFLKTTVRRADQRDAAESARILQLYLPEAAVSRNAPRLFPNIPQPFVPIVRIPSSIGPGGRRAADGQTGPMSKTPPPCTRKPRISIGCKL